MTDFLRTAGQWIGAIVDALDDKPSNEQPREADLRARVAELTRRNDELRALAEKRGQELLEADRIRPEVRVSPDGKTYALHRVFHERLGGPVMVKINALDGDSWMATELASWDQWIEVE